MEDRNWGELRTEEFELTNCSTWYQTENLIGKKELKGKLKFVSVYRKFIQQNWITTIASKPSSLFNIIPKANPIQRRTEITQQT